MSVNAAFKTPIIILLESKRGDIMGMDIFAYLLLQIVNGFDWRPEFGESNKFKNWIALLDIKTCLICRSMHGKIWEIQDKPEIEPEVHDRCRCEIKVMVTVKAGTATIKGLDGADWTLKYESELPDYYLPAVQAKENGWIPKLANLSTA